MSLLQPKKHLKFEALRKSLSSTLDKIDDPRQRKNCEFSVHDTMMSAFACMYFQDPSLLHFQQRLEKNTNVTTYRLFSGLSTRPKILSYVT